MSAGHICLDITPSFCQEINYESISELLIPGHLVPVGIPDIHIGGSVGNTGLALKRLGANVSFIGKIGKDDFGRLIKEQLKAYGVESTMIEQDSSETSYSVVLSVQGIDRIILHHSGANNTFSVADINFDLVKDANIFHFGYPTIMEKMYENDAEEFIYMMQKIKSFNVATSLDMALVDKNSESGKMDWKSVIKQVIPYIDIFAPSIEELAFLIERDKYDHWIQKSQGKDVTSIISIDRDIKPLADKLLEWGAKIVVIKCGTPGMYIRTNSKKEIEKVGGGLTYHLKEWEDQDFFERSYKPDKFISATGAGDTSIAAFLCAIMEGCTCKKALQLATGTGASCVEAYDALSGLRSFDELELKISQGWEKI